MPSRHIDKAVSLSWWVLFPATVALVAKLTVERACANPYDLLPAISSSPRWVWPLAGLYVGAHLWALVAYLEAVRETRSLFPSLGHDSAVSGLRAVQLRLMIAILILEYSPITLWRFVGSQLQCH